MILPETSHDCSRDLSGWGVKRTRPDEKEMDERGRLECNLYNLSRVRCCRRKEAESCGVEIEKRHHGGGT